MIDEQLKREQRQHQDAFRKFKKNCDEQEKKNDGSNSPYARHWKRYIFSELVQGLQQEIDNPGIYIRSSKATEAVRNCLGIKLVKKKRQKEETIEAQQLEMFDLELCAFVALQMTLDNALSQQLGDTIVDRKTGKLKKCKGQKNRDELIKEISSRIEQQLYFKYVNKLYPQFFKAVSKRCEGGGDDAPRSSAYYWRYNMMNAIKSKKEQFIEEGKLDEANLLDWRPFARSNKKHIGQWLLAGCIKYTSMFREVRVGEKKSLQVFIKLSELYEQRKEEYFANHQPFIWEDLPMITEPVEATIDNYGSWLTTVEQSKPDSNKGFLEISPLTLEYVNRLQKVAYKINPFVAKVMDIIYEQNLKLGKFVPHQYQEPASVNARCNLSHMTDYKEQSQALVNHPDYKEKRIERGREIAKQIKMIDQGRLARDIYLAMLKCRNSPELYFPYSWDFRQRCYSRCTQSPSPQGPDFSKALLKFTKECPVDKWTKHYLSIELANNAGMDKLNFDKRLKWTKKNEDKIKLVATMLDEDGDFNKGLAFLESIENENPWCFLAAADEYYHCCMLGDRTTTSLRVGMDMSCSGAGLMAGIRRCKTGATLVNVFPTNEPQDLYRACWDALVDLNDKQTTPIIRKEILQIWTSRKYGRAVAKKMIMVAQYGANEWKQMEEFYELHDELIEEEQLTKEEIKEFRKLWKQAMNEVCSFNFVVDWFQARVKEIFDSGANEIRIPTPTGSVQRMFYPIYKLKQVKSFYSGSMNYRDETRLTEYEPTDKPDLNKWLSSTPPNVIHSLDGSLLAIALHNFDEPFSSVHDAIYCYASNSMNKVLKKLKEAYVETVSFDIWTEFLKANNLPTDNPVSYPPIVGNFDIKEVLNSDYIFA